MNKIKYPQNKNKSMKKKQREIPELKDTTELKIFRQACTTKLHKAEERISELKPIKSEDQKENRTKKSKKSLQNLWDPIK